MQAKILVLALKDTSKSKGKVSLSKLLKSNKPIKVFEIKDRDLKKFCQAAKKYGVLYHVLKDKGAKDGKCDIMVRAEDASKVNRIFERFKLGTVDKATIRKAVEKSQQPKEQEKTAEDKFIEELFGEPKQKEKPYRANPSAAKTESSRPSEPTLGKQKGRQESPSFDRERKRPSVKVQLEKIREEQQKSKTRTGQTKAPTKIKRRKERKSMAEFNDIFNQNEEAKPTFNKEEWIKHQQENRTQAYEMLENATQEITTPDVFMSYLDVQSRFDRYSVSNALLVAHQMPEATRLCDAKTWKEHGVFIKKGESGILILEPGKEFKKQDGSVAVNYNAKKVFDVSQTTAKQYPKTHKSFNERLLVKALVKQSPVPVEISDKVPEEAGAVYQPDGKKIFVRKGMPGDEIFRCLSREIAHAKLDKCDYSREKCNLAASAISFIACERFGIEPTPIKGDELFGGMDSKGIRKELSNIRSEANSITTSIQKTLETKNKDVR